MTPSIYKHFFALIFLCFLSLGLDFQRISPALARDFPDGKDAQLKERIVFAVKWSFVPLIDTYMETYQLGDGRKPDLYRLTHQASMNAFWNDRMESIVNSRSLLPYRMETIIKDEVRQWKDSIIFERNLGRARLLCQDRENGGTTTNSVRINPTSMDPLSAFYFLRKRLSPSTPYLEVEGITGSRRFSLRGELVAQESIQVPAGTYDTYRLDCILEYWPQGVNASEKCANLKRQKKNPFTLWVSQDQHRFPVQIRYHLPLGSLWVQAISVQYYDLFS